MSELKEVKLCNDFACTQEKKYFVTIGDTPYVFCCKSAYEEMLASFSAPRLERKSAAQPSDLKEEFTKAISDNSGWVGIEHEKEFKTNIDAAATACAKICEDREREQAVKWISVEERLPDVGKKLLVFGLQKGMNPQMGGGYIFITRRQNITVQTNNMRPSFDDNGFELSQYVSHWMPLPEKPTL